MLTTLLLTILAYLHSFSCCCVRNLRNPAKLTEDSNLWSSRSSKVIDLGVNGKPIYDFLLVTKYSNFGRICYRFRDIDALARKSLNFRDWPLFEALVRGGGPLEFGDEIWRQKTRVLGLPEGEEIMPLAFFVLAQYRRVTDGRTTRCDRYYPR